MESEGLAGKLQFGNAARVIWSLKTNPAALCFDMDELRAGRTAGSAGWRWENAYRELPEIFFTRTLPTPVQSPQLVVLNRGLAEELGLDAEVLADSADFFAGNRVPVGTEPLAQAYAGHQFGHFTNLGDGRAILIGEHRGPGKVVRDIQWKGPGRTPYSRGGDGRAALGPMLREYLISEAMHGLGIPTTRSLAVAATGEQVVRQEMQPGAVLTRVAASHIRVGTFEYAAAHQDPVVLRALADFAISRHPTESSISENRFLDFFHAVMKRQSALVASWLGVGFIHGVMNTDNMAISGETIDYGPCAFMDVYDSATVFSSIDRNRRYAYGRQPEIARWNLARLAESLLPLFDGNLERAVELATHELEKFQEMFQADWLAVMRAKLGLFHAEAGDDALIQSLLDWMEATKQDYTIAFRSLSSPAAIARPNLEDARFVAWHRDWQARLGRQSERAEAVAERMRTSNPAAIPRNHMVEEVLAAASADADFGPFERFMEVLKAPFAEGLPEPYICPPPAAADPYKTYCGT